MTDFTLPNLVALGGKFRGGYPTVPAAGSFIVPNNNFDQVFPLEIISHKSAVATKPYEWASSNHAYKHRISAIGGVPPYRYFLYGGVPDGMTIGGSSIIQEFTRTFDAATGNYKYDMPLNSGYVMWQPTAGQVGQSFSVGIAVQDQLGALAFIRHVVTVDNSKFKYFSDAGNDSNDGSFAAPWLTFNKGYTFAGIQNFICVYDDGNYVVNNGTPGNDAGLSIIAKSHIAIGDEVTFDTSTGAISGSSNDVLFQGIIFDGSRDDVASNRIIYLNGKSDRLQVVGCTFQNMDQGIPASNNPGCVTSASLGGNDVGNYHEDMVVADNICKSTCALSLILTFSVQRRSVENNTSENNISLSGVVYSKESTQKDSIRFNKFETNGTTAVVRIDNQKPNRCRDMDVSHNILILNDTSTDGIGLSFNNQVSDPSTGLQNIVSQRNTFLIKTTPSRPAVYALRASTNEMPTVQTSVYVGQRATIVTEAGTSPAYIDGGNNTKLLIGDFDVNGSLIGSAKTTYAGISSADIYG